MAQAHAAIDLVAAARLAPADSQRSTMSLAIIVVAHDEAMARELEQMLTASAWPDARVLFPVADAVAEAQRTGAHALFIASGVVVAPFALERAWWVLDTRPEVSFVAFGDERGAATPMLESVAMCTLVRGSSVADSASSSDARWPGIAPLFALLEQGSRGHLVREPLLTRADALRSATAPVMRAVAELRTKGLTDVVLGDPGHDTPPPREPLQSLDERPLPTIDYRGPVAPGKRRILVLLQGFPMGGYTAFNADFLPRLVKQGHAVSVCTTEVWRTEWQLEAVRAATPDVVHAAGVVPLSSMPRFVSHLIESRGIDTVLVSHSMAGYRMLPWLRRRHSKTAFVDYVHTDWFESQMYGSYAALAAGSAEWLDAQVASSEALARDLVRRGANDGSTSAVTINLDVEDWDPARFQGDPVRAALGCKPGQPL